MEPLREAGLGICPADAVDRAKQAADLVLQNAGGQGCLWELIQILRQKNEKDLPEHYFCQRLEEHADIFKVMASDQKLMCDVMKAAEDVCGIMRQWRKRRGCTAYRYRICKQILHGTSGNECRSAYCKYVCAYGSRK